MRDKKPIRHIENRAKWQMWVLLINNYFKCKWIKSISIEMDIMDKKTHDPIMCSLKVTHFRYKDANRLKVNGWVKNIPCK